MGFGSDLSEPFRTVAGGSVLGAGDSVFFQGLVNIRGQLDLDSRVLLFNAMGRSVVQGNPVGKDIVGIEPLDEKEGFFHGR